MLPARQAGNSLRPSVDRAVGRARGLVRQAIGPREYDAIRESVATEASRILGDVATNLVRFDDEIATVVAVHRGSVPVGMRYPIDEGTAPRLVHPD